MFRSRRASEAAGLLAGEPRRRAELRLVDGQAQPAPRQPEPRGRGPGRRGRRAGLDRRSRPRQTRGFGRWLAGRQAYLFFPLLTLEGLALHVASVRALLGRQDRPTRGRSAYLPGADAAPRVEARAARRAPGRLPRPRCSRSCRRCKALVFSAIHQGLWGLYMGCSFAPNHKGMPMPTAEDELDFLRKQVLTSRNVRGGWFVDVALGGLNYQIEHHLFPSMPRANLRRAQPIVAGVLRRAGHPVRSRPGWSSRTGRRCAHLHEVGRPLRAGLSRRGRTRRAWRVVPPPPRRVRGSSHGRPGCSVGATPNRPARAVRQPGRCPPELDRRR